MQEQSRNLRFKFAFICITPECGYELERETFRAILEGAGLEVICPQCYQVYLADLHGATPITKEMIEQIKKELRPYRNVQDQAMTLLDLHGLGIHTPRFPPRN